MLLYETTPVWSICLILMETMILIPPLCCSSTCLNSVGDIFISSWNQAILCILLGKYTENHCNQFFNNGGVGANNQTPLTPAIVTAPATVY